MGFGKNKSVKKKIRKNNKNVFISLLIIFIVLAALTFDSNTRIVTEEYPVSSLKIPAAFNGYRIVQLTDLHGKSFGSANTQLVNAVRAAKPDIIVITGDLIDNKASGEWARILLTQLKTIAPVYFVTGNHEWASGGLVELFSILKDCGITALRNDYLVLSKGKDSIILAGIDDPNGFADQKTPQQLFGEIKHEQPDKYCILLAHRNTMIDTYAATGTDLVLTGHGHGGIIRLPLIGGLISTDRVLFSKYDTGFFIMDKTAMFVSRGLGQIWNIPRFLNNPEVSVLVLKK